MLKDFVDEIIQNITIAAGKGLNQVLGIGLSAQGQRQQLQSRRPAFRALLQRRHITAIQFPPRGLPQKCGRFVERELQIGLTNFRQLIAGAEP